MVELLTVKNGKIVDLMPYYRDTVPEAEAAGMCEIIRARRRRSHSGFMTSV